MSTLDTLVAPPNPWPTPFRGEDTVSWASRLASALTSAFGKLHFLLGGNLRWQNLRAALLSTTTPGTANTAFTLTHSLGKIPELFIPNPDQAAIVYADATDRGNWTTTTIDLKCDTASVALTVLVL